MAGSAEPIVALLADAAGADSMQGAPEFLLGVEILLLVASAIVVFLVLRLSWESRRK